MYVNKGRLLILTAVSWVKTLKQCTSATPCLNGMSAENGYEDRLLEGAQI